jgi:membrane peptidoglycan carboxypeptidase
VDKPVATAQAMGMHFDHPQDLAECSNKCDDYGAYMQENELGSFTFGTIATSPLDIANAYATVAASGTRCEPTPVVSILDRNGQPVKGDDGKVLDLADKCTPNAIAPGVANTLANMMVGVITGGTGKKAQIPGHDIAGKTGTTQENKTAAFVGITPKYAVSVLYFDPKGDVHVGGHGGGTPAQIFHDAMAPIMASQPNTPFAPPDPAVAAGTRGRGYTPPAPAPTPTAPNPDQPTTDTPATEPPPAEGQPGPGYGDNPFGEGFPFNN